MENARPAVFPREQLYAGPEIVPADAEDEAGIERKPDEDEGEPETHRCTRERENGKRRDTQDAVPKWMGSAGDAREEFAVPIDSFQKDTLGLAELAERGIEFSDSRAELISLCALARPQRPVSGRITLRAVALALAGMLLAAFWVGTNMFHVEH
jgi:hypothetical protein